MKKQLLIPLALLCILVTAFLVAPVSAGLNVTDGAKITSPYGTTSPVITITGSNITAGGTITIDVINTYYLIYSGKFTDANLVISSNAANATWTGAVSGAGDLITLTSTVGNTTVGENITLTFTGAGGNPWMPGTTDTYGDMFLPLTVTRTDTSETATINFWIETASIPPGGLTITDGVKITSPNGATSPVITIADSDISAGGTFTIAVPDLFLFVKSGNFTDANIIVNDTASAATWSGLVSGETGLNKINLTSTGGNTTVGETITVTFTGAGGNPWGSDTSSQFGDMVLPLTVTRTDTFQTAYINFDIETTPPNEYLVKANFTASQISDSAPLTVTFRDSSLGNPTSWNWDFGDGATSTDRNPVHTYTDVGTYTVSLTATNAYRSDTKTEWDYIKVLKSATSEANTAISGLTITNCRGSPQSVMVNTSILPVVLLPNNSVLELLPPLDSGFKNITFYTQSVNGFTRKGNVIVGKLSGVHLVSEDIAPSEGFSNDIGPNSSFSYSMYLSSYPCDAKLSTKIWEGVLTKYDNKFRQILDGNNAGVAGTAYSAKITKTNFPSDIKVTLLMSIDSGWNPSLPSGGGVMDIWRIADDENSGKVLPTTHLYTDPVNNLDFYEAYSPSGLSTFGLSAITGNNNPFQMVAFVAAQAVNSATGGGDKNTPVVVQTTSAPEIKSSLAPDLGKTAKIYSNADGVISQQTTLMSNDGFANVSLGLGVVAKDSTGKPLSSISITRVADGNLPPGSPGADLSFTGMAYEIQPDGVTFSPSVPVAFTIPQAKWGQEYVMNEFDHTTGTWKTLESSYDPKTSVITTYISHLCCFALFAKTPAVENAVIPPPTTTIIVSSKSSMETNVQLYTWVLSSIRQNPVIIIILVAVIGVVAYFGWWKRRL